jgi:hypothetical protein
MAGGWSGKLAKDKNGRWWGILFGDNYHAPWFMRMGLIPLVVTKIAGVLDIRVAEPGELTDAEKEVISVKF